MPALPAPVHRRRIQDLLLAHFPDRLVNRAGENGRPPIGANGMEFRVMISRTLPLVVLSVVLTAPASADVFSYEIVDIMGRNNVVDSNAISCDSVE